MSKRIPKIAFFMALVFWMIPFFYYFIRFKHNISMESDPLFLFWIFALFWFSAFAFSTAALIIDRKISGLKLWQKILSWFMIVLFLIVVFSYTIIPLFQSNPNLEKIGSDKFQLKIAILWYPNSIIHKLALPSWPLYLMAATRCSHPSLCQICANNTAKHCITEQNTA
jgi:hypothetical protein